MSTPLMLERLNRCYEGGEAVSGDVVIWTTLIGSPGQNGRKNH